MEKICDRPELMLGLRLGISGHEHSSADDDDSGSTNSDRVVEYWLRNTAQQKQQQQQQQITIFYNGAVCVCDATEIQARAIICMARKEMEKIDQKSNHQQKQQQSSSPVPPLLPQLININPELSMKRSLQRFLQKRKKRMENNNMPYTPPHHSPSPLPSSYLN